MPSRTAIPFSLAARYHIYFYLGAFRSLVHPSAALFRQEYFIRTEALGSPGLRRDSVSSRDKKIGKVNYSDCYRKYR